MLTIVQIAKKEVSPVVSDAMPGATIGHRAVILAALLHYRIGVTISKIIDIFNTRRIQKYCSSS